MGGGDVGEFLENAVGYGTAAGFVSGEGCFIEEEDLYVVFCEVFCCGCAGRTRADNNGLMHNFFIPQLIF